MHSNSKIEKRTILSAVLLVGILLGSFYTLVNLGKAARLAEPNTIKLPFEPTKEGNYLMTESQDQILLGYEEDEIVTLMTIDHQGTKLKERFVEYNRVYKLHTLADGSFICVLGKVAPMYLSSYYAHYYVVKYDHELKKQWSTLVLKDDEATYEDSFLTAEEELIILGDKKFPRGITLVFPSLHSSSSKLIPNKKETISEKAVASEKEVTVPVNQKDSFVIKKVNSDGKLSKTRKIENLSIDSRKEYCISKEHLYILMERREDNVKEIKCFDLKTLSLSWSYEIDEEINDLKMYIADEQPLTIIAHKNNGKNTDRGYLMALDQEGSLIDQEVKLYTDYRLAAAKLDPLKKDIFLGLYRDTNIKNSDAYTSSLELKVYSQAKKAMYSRQIPINASHDIVSIDKLQNSEWLIKTRKEIDFGQPATLYSSHIPVDYEITYWCYNKRFKLLWKQSFDSHADNDQEDLVFYLKNGTLLTE